MMFRAFTLRILALGLVVASAAADAAGGDVVTERRSDGSFTLILKTKNADRDVPALQTQLVQTATRLCKGIEPSFGHYEFVAMRRTGTPKRGAYAQRLTFWQDVRCGKAIVAPTAAIAPVFDAAKGDDARVIAATQAYFAARDQGRYADVYAMLGAGLRADETETRWTEKNAKFNADAGRGSRRVIRVTWYDNPDGAPPGLYAAADYTGDFEKLAATCGYLIWAKRPGDAGFLLTRQEEGVATKAVVAKMSAEDRANLRTSLQCRD